MTMHYQIDILTSSVYIYSYSKVLILLSLQLLYSLELTFSFIMKYGGLLDGY